jgi:hypothetical protein
LKLQTGALRKRAGCVARPVERLMLGDVRPDIHPRFRHFATQFLVVVSQCGGRGKRIVTASKYKVWAWGGPVGLGATGSVFVGMSAVAKMATPAAPYIVGNELVCNMIARALLLPCPPGALLQKNGDTYFCSLDFNTAGHALPPISPSTVVGALPELSWGVVLFDVLIMNADRHPQNISYNTTTGELTLFDHSHAFMTTGGDVDVR